jgi:aspartate-semialdehyde dehydrogenase
VRYVAPPSTPPSTTSSLPLASIDRHPQARILTSSPPGVLGCTGSVGQRFVLLLNQHPSLKLVAVGASSRSAGKKYRDAARWKQASPMGAVGDLIVRECKPSEFADCDVVFSGLDSDVAGEVGE